VGRARRAVAFPRVVAVDPGDGREERALRLPDGCMGGVGRAHGVSFRLEHVFETTGAARSCL